MRAIGKSEISSCASVSYINDKLVQNRKRRSLSAHGVNSMRKYELSGIRQV